MSKSPRASQGSRTREPIVVYPNKGRVFALATLSAAIIVGAVLVLILDPKYNRIPAISGVIAAALIVGGGGTVVEAVLRVCSSDPQLVVSGDGITVRLQSLGPAQFAWKEIVSLTPGKLFGSSYLGIQLESRCAELYLGRLRGVRRLYFLLMHPRLKVGNQLAVGSAYLSIPIGEILARIRQEYQSEVSRNGVLLH